MLSLFNLLKFHLKKDFWIATLIFFTIVLSIFFRVYNYSERVYIESDNTRDAQVAQYALDHSKIPRIGQFTSAGPFFYGPIWYWVLELFSIFPFGPLKQWYLMSVLGLVLVFLSYKTGSELGGTRVGVLTAFLAAISPLTIRNSLAIWNPASVPLFVLVSLYFLIRYQKTHQIRYAFLTSLTVATAMTIHFQNILTAPVLLAVLVLGKFSLKKMAALALGTALPFIPLLWFDLQNHWYNFGKIYWYLKEGQYAIWVPNRWLTYAFDYWPKATAEIIGGNFYISYLIIISLIIIFLLHVKRIKKHLPAYTLLGVFLMEIVLFRYYRGERYLYYSYFAIPTLILLTSWMIERIFRRTVFLGSVIFILIAGGTLWSSWTQMTPPRYAYSEVMRVKNEIYSAYPGQSFSVHGCLFNGNTVAHPLSFFMYIDRKNSKEGIKIGTCESNETIIAWRALKDTEVGQPNSGWINKDTSQVFEETAEWFKRNPPK